MTHPPAATDQLRREAAGLAVDDILALCYHFEQKHQLERLRLYMDVLRQSAGERAQFASALICFDLARQGDAVAQHDFGFLVDTIRGLAGNEQLVDQLVGGDRYLRYVWDLCQAHLEQLDLRFSGPEIEPAPAASVDLLSDADFKGELPDLSVDDARTRHRFEEALEAFLGGTPGMPVFDAEAGFRLHNGRDVERVEAFLLELDSLREFVRIARGYRALTLLFYGTHMRSKNLFGVVNGRKQETLRAGLAEYAGSGHMLPDLVGVLSPLHSEPDAWMKVADVVHDYLAYCAADPDAARKGPAGYDAVGRLVARDQARGRTRR